MGGRKDDQIHPMEQTNDEAKTDVESSRAHSEEHRRKKDMKCLAYVAAFSVFLTAIILAFSLTIMHITSPKLGFRSIEVDSLSINSSTTSPAFNMKFDAAITVKNANFGHFKYDDNSTITFAYGGTRVGEAFISKGHARARHSKEIVVSVDLTSRNVSSSSHLASDINSGILSLSSHGKLRGKVRLLKVFKMKKSPQMNCTISINLVNKVIQDWNCS